MQEINEKFEKNNEDILANLEGTQTPQKNETSSTQLENSYTITLDESSTEDKKQQPETQPETQPENKENELEEEGFEIGELSDKKPLEIELKEEDKGKVFEIEDVEKLPPKTKDEEGKFISPKAFSDKPDSKVGYKSKLKITFKDSDYVSYVPNIKWYPGVTKDGRKILNPWFPIKGLTEEKVKSKYTPEISKLYYKFCNFKGIEPGKITQQEFIEHLKGEKGKLGQYSEEFNGKMSHRIDIEEFVE